MRPDEQRALDVIATHLEASDPGLARALSGSPRRRGTRADAEAAVRTLVIAALWLMGIAFGTTLLALGLDQHVGVTTTAGAALTAAVVGVAVVVLLRHRRHAL